MSTVKYCGESDNAQALFKTLNRVKYGDTSIKASMVISEDTLYIHGNSPKEIAAELVYIVATYSKNKDINRVYNFTYGDGFIIVSKDCYVHKTLTECMEDVMFNFNGYVTENKKLAERQAARL